MDRSDDALKQFGLWLGGNDKDMRRSRVLNERCWLRTRLNLDLALALKDCKDSIALDGDSSATLDSLGWTYLRLGDAEKAKASFDEAITRDASQAFSLYGRSLARARLGDTAAGERDLAAALKIRPDIVDTARKRGLAF